MNQFLVRASVAIVMAVVACPVFAADDWVDMASISPSTTLVTNTLCYTDGRDIACDGAAGLLTTSGTLSINAISTPSIGAGNIAMSGSLTDATLISTSAAGVVSAYAVYARYISGSVSIPAGTISIDDLSDASSTLASGNLFMGTAGGGVIVTGTYNTGVGLYALASATSGAYNTALGYGALRKVTTSTSNTAIGYMALANFPDGQEAYTPANTAVGSQALYSAANGSLRNTAMGAAAMKSNSIGGYNVAFGNDALGVHTAAMYSVAIGDNAMGASSKGTANIGIGFQTLSYQKGSNVIGIGNNIGWTLTLASTNTTVVGHHGGFQMTDAERDILIGNNTGYALTGGDDNVAMGYYAAPALTTGASNTLIGGGVAPTLATGNSNIVIGVLADVPAVGISNFLNIGNGISGSIASGGSLTIIGGLKANDVVTATYFEGDGSRLTNLAAASMAIDDLTDASSTVASGNMFFGNGNGNAITTGNTNSGMGIGALASVTSGSSNTALGYWSLLLNTTGSYNTAVGGLSLVYNTSGQTNTAVGFQSLYVNSTGAENTAVGYRAMSGNTTAGLNTAVGYRAMSGNTTGGANTVMGHNVMRSNSSGGANSAFGIEAMYSNTTGYNNTVTGAYALYNNTTGGGNTAIGRGAGNTNTAGSSNTLIGAFANAGATGNRNIVIGATMDVPDAGISDWLNIGNAISGSMASGGSLTIIGGLKANGVVTATYFEGDGSRLTNLAAGTTDRIVSDSTSAIAYGDTGVVGVSGTVSATMVRIAADSTACGPGMYGTIKFQNNRPYICRASP